MIDRVSRLRPLRTPDAWLAALVTFASGLLYVLTAAPTVATIFDDSLEFQVVLPTLGIAHPSGYPLYTLLGHLAAVILPWRDPAGRVNLLSALCAAAAVGSIYLSARRLAGSRLAALLAALAFALIPAWWAQATLAEVYALHGLLLAGCIFFLLRWEEAVSLGRPAFRYLALAAVTFGLGLAHHRMIALLAPAALVFILWVDPALIRQPRRWLTLLGLGLAPLALYLYLPWRGSQGVTSLDGTFVATWIGARDWILARAYSVFLTGNPFNITRSVGDLAALVQTQLGAVTLGAAFVGVSAAWRLQRRRSVFLAVATVTHLAFAAAYKVADVEVFFLPVFMLLCLWAAFGWAWGWAALSRAVAHVGRPSGRAGWLRPAGRTMTALLLAGLSLWPSLQQAKADWTQLDRSRAWAVYEFGEDMVANVAPGGMVVGLLGETTLVRYFRDVLGVRSDIALAPADAEAARFAAVDAALAAGQPVYLTRDLPGAAARYSLDAAGPLIAVSPKAPAASTPVGQPVGAGVFLVSRQVELRPQQAGQQYRVRVTWAAAEPLKEELKISARLLDAVGGVIAAVDSGPVHFAYPTTAWAPGELVSDVHDLTWTPGAAPPQHILLILYRAADGSEVGRVELALP